MQEKEEKGRSSEAKREGGNCKKAGFKAIERLRNKETDANKNH